MRCEHDAVELTVHLLATDERRALVRCTETGREAFVELANADMQRKPSGHYSLTLEAAEAAQCGLH